MSIGEQCGDPLPRVGASEDCGAFFGKEFQDGCRIYDARPPSPADSVAQSPMAGQANGLRRKGKEVW